MYYVHRRTHEGVIKRVISALTISRDGYKDPFLAEKKQIVIEITIEYTNSPPSSNLPSGKSRVHPCILTHYRPTYYWVPILVKIAECERQIT